MDRTYNKPLDEVILADTRILLPTIGDKNIMQDIMCSAPGNRVFLRALKAQNLLRQRLKRVDGWASDKGILEMGPRGWNKAVGAELFGKSLKDDWSDNPGSSRVRKARALFEQAAPLILTYKEQWCDGMFVVDFPGCKSISRGPLYGKYFKGIHWSVAVKSKWNASGVPVE